MRSLLLLSLFATAAFGLPSFKADTEWLVFKNVHGKKYENSAEDARRKLVWQESVEKVASHNRQYDLGLVTYRMAVNQFADLTFEEFSEIYTPRRVHRQPTKTGKYFVPSKKSDTPDEVDWRNSGAVTPVKNQGVCGSCYSFATTGTLEGQMKLRKGTIVPLSEQNIMDCSGNYGNNGCNGGFIDRASYDYIIDYGIMNEENYPYDGEVMNCRYDSSQVAANMYDYCKIGYGDEDTLTRAVAEIGPIGVCIDASNNFRYYDGGVLIDYDCSSQYTNHCVLVVGYGTEDGNDYYLVKNSWGTGFGEDGYIKMSRNRDNQCAIATDASYPLVESGQTCNLID